MSLESIKYPNGFTLHVDHMPEATVTAVDVVVPFGSVHEPAGLEGAAHALEHCMLLKNPTCANRDEIDMQASLDSMEHGAHTLYTYTAYETVGLSADPQFRHMSDTLEGAVITNEAVAHEMNAVRQEAVSDLDDAGMLHTYATQYALFGAPYGRSVAGHYDKLHFTGNTLRKLRQSRYALGATTMVVVGATPIEEAAVLIERYFNTTDSMPTADAVAPPRHLSEPGVSGLTLSWSDSLHLSVGYPIPLELTQKMLRNLELYTVAENLISGSFFSLARNGKGIAYTCEAAAGSHNHPNAWMYASSITTAPDNQRQASQVSRDALAYDGSEYPDILIRSGLARRTLDAFLTLASIEKRMGSHIFHLAMGEPIVSQAEKTAQLQQLSVADVRAAIDELAALTATQPAYEHRTGSKTAVGRVDRHIQVANVA